MSVNVVEGKIVPGMGSLHLGTAGLFRENSRGVILKKERQRGTGRKYREKRNDIRERGAYMERRELPEVTPESVGIKSSDIIRFVRELEASGTEMHGFVILRHGRIAAKGWWQPFAQNIPHSDQSLTKTVTGTAYGIAEKEGLLSLEDRVADIFPEYAGNCKGTYWGQLKMRHILTMASGMETMPSVKSPDWIREFFGIPIVHEPGTAFYYNSIACSMVGACITRKTGLGLKEYLTPRLFRKLGIHEDCVGWLNHPDGSQNGSGGIITTTLDNARLMQLYLQKGKWEGEQILSPDWVEFATRMQNPVDVEHNRGYGGMMWIRDHAYYADGAMGQLAVGFPENDMVISLHQTVSTPEANQKMTDALFAFGQKEYPDSLPEDGEGAEELRNFCRKLALPAPPCSGSSPWQARIEGKRCEIREGKAAFFPEDVGDIFNEEYHDYADAFTFCFPREGFLVLEVESASGRHLVQAGMEGRGCTNEVKGRIPMTAAVLSACWKEENVLTLDIRWLENCRTRKLEFCFGEEEIRIRSIQQEVGGFDVPPMEAKAVWKSCA